MIRSPAYMIPPPKPGDVLASIPLTPDHGILSDPLDNPASGRFEGLGRDRSIIGYGDPTDHVRGRVQPPQLGIVQ